MISECDKMMMQQECPYCNSKSLHFYDKDDEWVSDDSCIRTWKVKCDRNHEFIISEVLMVTSRLVAKDDDELDKLIKEEEKEEMDLNGFEVKSFE